MTEAKLKGWAKAVGWEKLLNKAGTTFKKLPDADKEGLTEAKAHRADGGGYMIKQRPVLEAGGKDPVGFKPEDYAALKPGA